MAGSHYPDYYLKKRRRETAYRRIVSFTIGIALFAILGIGAGFFIWKIWYQNSEQVNPAERREALKTETRLANAPVLGDAVREQTEAPGSTPAREERADLSAIEYGQSLPAIKVSIGGSNQPASAPLVVDPAVTGEPGVTAELPPPTPPESQIASDAFKKNDTAAPVKAEDSTKPETKPDETKPGSAKPAEKQPEKKPESSSTPEKPAEKDPGKSPEQAGSGLVCHVYAGACHTKDEADKMKSNLALLGFQSSIIESRVDFLVRVASLTEVDAAEALTNKLKDSGFSNAFATRTRK